MIKSLFYFFQSVFIVLCLTISLQSQTIEQKLVVVQNDQTIGGVFSIQVQVKGTSLPAANTLGSATIDVQFNNTHLTYVSATAWAFGSGQGYNRSATNNTTFIRIGVTGGSVNQDGGGVPPGFDIGSTYTSWVQLNFTIQSLVTTDLTIATGSQYGIGLFENHSNDPLTGVINNQTLTAPENIVGAPLPVELSSFSASNVNDAVNLKWQTATEVNNYGFDIERKPSDGEWQKVGFVSGNGNSNSSKAYSYTDASPVGGSKLQYRLKQIDNDGSFKYSDVVEVDVMPTKFELSQNYPNPFNPSTTIKFSLPKDTKLKINLYNMLGQLVETITEGTYEAGYHKVTFNASSLTSGVYIYRIESSDFVQVRKMVLLK